MTAAVLTSPNLYDLAAGTVYLTVTLPETFVRTQQLLGNDAITDAYTYRIDRVEQPHGNYDLYAQTLTERKNREPEFVYTGAIDGRTGNLIRTRNSSFPAHSNRFRVLRRVLTALATNRVSEIVREGWALAVTIENSVERF